MRSFPKEQRLASLESAFKPLLLKCLRECAEGRWGLFGQNDYDGATQYLAWPEAEELVEMADEIRRMRSGFGRPNPLCERLLEFRSMRGSNVKGEPKLAHQFLSEIGET